MLALALAGCGKGGKSKNEGAGREKPPPSNAAKETKEPQRVGSGPGELTHFAFDAPGERGQREKRWTIHWESVDLEISETGRASGEMRTVTGTIFENGVAVSTFSAHRGQAPKGSEDLLLKGEVEFVSVARKASRSKSPLPHSKLNCDAVVWRPQLKRVEAKGNVRLDLPPWQLGVLPELWVTPKLDRAATPDLFVKK